MKTEPILLALLCVLGSHAYSRDDDSDEVNLERPQFVLDKQTFSRRAYDQAKPPREAESLSGQDLIDYVNARQNLWTAKVQPRIQGMSQRAIQSLMGVKDVESNITIEKNISETRFLDIKIPKSFDARKKWPKCKSIKNIRDQSSCGSCWAFGAVEAMSDRICIASKGKIQVTLSADDLLSCCRFCGPGCKGGKPILAWHYWMWNGIVTGSNHELNQGCKPYPFPTCEHISNKTHYPHCKHDFYPTPKCTKTCQSEYKKSYKADKFYGKNAYHIDNSVEAIQKELITHGPIEVAFEVYEDFLSYNGGVYVNQGGKFKGRHAVKLIGWGVDNTVPYWLVANSWNTDWGEKGFFKILRGVNECGIESGGVAGIPKLDTSDFDLEDDLD